MSFLLPFFIPFVISLILTPLTIFFARKYGFVDDPKTHKHPALLHTKVIPRAGGLPIFGAFLITSLILVPFSQKLAGILIGGFILILVGIADDKYDNKSYVKLLGQFLAALVVVASGVGINFITNPFFVFNLGGIWLDTVIHLDVWRLTFSFLGSHSIVILADLFALLWIVWVINMVNFSSGVDGQMPGIVFIALLVIFAATLRFVGQDPSQLIVAKLALIGAGGTLGFLVFNFYPAKIFPGDSASYFLGFLVATFSILAGARVGTAVLVMAVPLIDGVFTIIRRAASRQSPLQGDRKHLHHRLMSLGWGQRRIALFYWILCAILGSAALLLHSNEKFFAGLVAAVLILGGLVWLNMNLSPKPQK